MNEPLKNKKFSPCSCRDCVNRYAVELEDVASAVEYLKEELCKRIKPYNRNGMLKVIDEAFEDVIEKDEEMKPKKEVHCKIPTCFCHNKLKLNEEKSSDITKCIKCGKKMIQESEHIYKYGCKCFPKSKDLRLSVG